MMFNRFLQTPWFTILVLATLFFLGAVVLRARPRQIVVEKRRDNLQSKIAELEKSNRDLTSLLNYFRSPEYLELEAKQKLNVKRPDEQVAFVFPESRLANDSPLAAKKKSLWETFKDWLFKELFLIGKN